MWWKRNNNCEPISPREFPPHLVACLWCKFTSVPKRAHILTTSRKKNRYWICTFFHIFSYLSSRKSFWEKTASISFCRRDTHTTAITESHQSHHYNFFFQTIQTLYQYYTEAFLSFVGVFFGAYYRKERRRTMKWNEIFFLRNIVLLCISNVPLLG